MRRLVHTGAVECKRTRAMEKTEALEQMRANMDRQMVMRKKE